MSVIIKNKRKGQGSENIEEHTIIISTAEHPKKLKQKKKKKRRL